MNICGYCDYLTSNPEDDFGEFICDNCQQNREEAAYERYCEDFHDGGSSWPKSLLELQVDARRLK